MFEILQCAYCVQVLVKITENLQAFLESETTKVKLVIPKNMKLIVTTQLLLTFIDCSFIPLTEETYLNCHLFAHT